jgi:WD40 repeat protein
VEQLRSKAFISYSRRMDASLAAVLQHTLQSFGKRWYELRTFRIFRDTTALPISSSLWSDLEKELMGSEYLLYLASPLAATSPWVERELESWVRAKGAEKLLVVLTEGEVPRWDEATSEFLPQQNGSIPECIRNAFTSEPSYLDLRWARLDPRALTVRDSRFHNAVLTIAATLRNTPKDELDSLEARNHRVLKRIGAGAVLSIAILALLGASLSGVLIDKRRDLIARQLASASAADLANDPQLVSQSLLASALSLSIAENRQARQTIAEAVDLLPPGKRLEMLDQEARISLLTFTPDSQLVVALLGADDAAAWSRTTGRILAVTSKASTYPSCEVVANSEGRPNFNAVPDDVRLELSIVDLQYCLWELPINGEPRLAIRGTFVTPEDGADRVFVRADKAGSLMLRIADDNEFAVDRLGSGRPIGVALDRTRRRIAVWSQDGLIRAWRTIDGRELARLPSQYGTQVAMSPDGDWLVTGTRRDVQLWDLRIPRLASGEFRNVSFSQSGTHIAALGLDRRLQIYFDAGRALLWSAQTDSDSAVFAFNSSETLLAVGYSDGVLCIHDLNNDGLPRCLRDQGSIESVTFDAPGRTLYAATSGDGVRAYSAQIEILENWAEWGRSAALIASTNDPASVVAVGRDGRAHRVERQDSGFSVRDVSTVKPDIVARSASGGRIAIGDAEGRVQIIDARSLDSISSFDLAGPVARLVVSRDGEIVVAATPLFANRGIAWSVREKREVARFPLVRSAPVGPPVLSSAIALDDIGHRIAMTQFFGIRIHSMSDGKEEEIVSRDSPDSIAFSPDNRLLAFVGTNRVGRFSQILTIYSLDSRLAIASFRLNDSTADLRGTNQSVDFSPNSRYVVVRSGDKVMLYLWSAEELIGEVCAKVGRNLLLNEWETLVGAGVPYQRVCAELPSPVYEYAGQSIRNFVRALRSWLWL